MGSDTQWHFKDNAVAQAVGGNMIANLFSVGRYRSNISALNVAARGGRALAVGDAALGAKRLAARAFKVLNLGLDLPTRLLIDGAFAAGLYAYCASITQ